MRESSALISMQMRLFSAQDLTREILGELSKFGNILKISSIYHLGQEKGGSAGVCIECFSSLSALTLNSYLDELAKRWAEKGLLALELLSYGDETLISMELTLPHPEWHLRGDLLIPAAEIAPNYEHPVLQAPLSALAKSLYRGEAESKIRPLPQNKGLLDF